MKNNDTCKLNDKVLHILFTFSTPKSIWKYICTNTLWIVCETITVRCQLASIPQETRSPSLYRPLLQKCSKTIRLCERCPPEIVLMLRFEQVYCLMWHTHSTNEVKHTRTAGLHGVHAMFKYCGVQHLSK